MRQTFYIDSDEEISSVIERLRKSLAEDNYFVLSKRALVMQSVVNLKLLKREADKLNKQIIIVTQDEIGANMAVKAGIAVADSADEIAEEIETKNSAERTQASGGYEESEGAIVVAKSSIKKKAAAAKDGMVAAHSMTEKVGSNDFYEIHEPIMVRVEHAGNKSMPRKGQDKPVQLPKMTAERVPVLRNRKTTLDPHKEEVLERIYTQSQPNKSLEVEIPIRGRTKKILTAFVVLCCLAFAGTAVYLFMPKAHVVVTMAAEKKKVDVDVLGAEGDVLDVDAAKMPIRILREEQELILTYPATGQVAAAGAKAHGKVIIYNAYSEQPQTLIATTRLETADGKIFRLLKNLVVPGVTQVAGELKPGVIEAEVVADQAGEAYNIEPATFSIPGFKDSPKFEKISAKSTQAMVGGGVSGSSVKAVSLRDLENAKRDAEAQLKAKMKEAMQVKLNQEEMLLDESMYFTFAQSGADAKVDAQQDSFAYHVKAESAAMIFSSEDTKRILVGAFQAANGGKEAMIEKVRIDYAGVTPDFDKKTLSLKMHGEVALGRKLDENKLKTQLLGKSVEEAATIIKQHQGVANITFEFEPTFVSRVPQYIKRVWLEVKTEN